MLSRQEMNELEYLLTNFSSLSESEMNRLNELVDKNDKYLHKYGLGTIIDILTDGKIQCK